jgi:type IV secretory pathway VirB6-like protein
MEEGGRRCGEAFLNMVTSTNSWHYLMLQRQGGGGGMLCYGGLLILYLLITFYMVVATVYVACRLLHMLA